MKNRKINAGFVQFCPELGNSVGNTKFLENLFNQKDLPEILVLPELANSGYNFSSHAEAFSFSETLQESSFIEFLTETSRKRNMFIVSGFNERDHDRIFNTAVLTGPQGYIGKYRKIHLFMDEKDYFTPGDLGFNVFNTEAGNIGILVCFDYMFPEAWRVLGLNGAELVCHPSNLVTPYAQRVVPPMSIINRYFIITCNRTGEERGLTFTGQSFITDPEGDILYVASKNETLLYSQEIDLAETDNKFITKRNHVIDDRRPEHYGDLIC